MMSNRHKPEQASLAETWLTPHKIDTMLQSITAIIMIMITCRVSSQMELCQAKVAQLDIALGIIEDVVWLQISVDDALGVDVSQTCQRLPYHLHCTSNFC